VQSVPLAAVFSNIIQSPYYGVVIPSGVIGVKTAYCQNSDSSALCPSWVDAAVLARAVTAGGTTTKTILSYAPLTTP
jgi:methionyl-tRNA formyltransferase